MTVIAFYHLLTTSAAAVLPVLLEKTLAGGARAWLLCESGRGAQFSSALWTARERSWLPHGMRGRDDESAAFCPIWITHDPEDNANDAGYLFMTDGFLPTGFDALERGFILFDGNDDSALATARRQWAELKKAGHPLSYWQQEQAGGWKQQA